MSIINFYKTIKSEKKLNPNYNKHHLNIEFRGIICTSSGGGKTNLITNILYDMSDTFHKIIIITKEEEKLYTMIEERLKGQKDQIKIFYGGTIPELENLSKKHENGLVIIDDMILDQSKAIGEIFIRARKLNWSSVFISQSYFGIQKLIRQNCNYVWLGRGIIKRDLKLILSEYSINIPIEKLINLYNTITERKMNFLLIDLDDRTIRKNISDIIQEF